MITNHRRVNNRRQFSDFLLGSKTNPYQIIEHYYDFLQAVILICLRFSLLSLDTSRSGAHWPIIYHLG